MVTMVNNRQLYINRSHRYCLKVTKFHWNHFSDFKAVEESFVADGGVGRRLTHI